MSCQSYKKVLPPTVILLGLLMSNYAIAVDTLPMTSADPGAVGKVSSARVMKKGTYKSGMNIDGSDLLRVDQAINSKSRSSEKSGVKGVVYGSGHQTYVNFSYGLSRYIEFDLGLKGTTEVVQTSVRNQLFEDNRSYRLGKQKLKETAYAGARAMIKIQLLKSRSSSLVFAPFLEEGLGEMAKYSITRASKARAGWMLLGGYGKRGIGGINLNLGMRYREPQVFADRLLRNELIARMSIRAFVGRKIAVFGSLGGRRLMMADASKFDKNGKPLYAGNDSAEILGGLAFFVGKTTLSIYRGSTIRQFDGFGNGQNTYGMSISTKLPTARYGAVTEITRKRAKKQREGRKRSATSSNGEKTSRDYSEMSGVVSSVSFDSGPMDDFARLRKKMKKQHRTKRALVTEQERVEKELRILQAAEQRVEEERELRRKIARQREQIEDIRTSKKKIRRKTRKSRKVRAYLDDEYSITVGDTQWNGLD